MKTKKILVSGLVLSAVLFTGIVIGAQVNMQQSLDFLEKARAELQQADNDKGGHRAKAMNAIDAAIDEVRAGIRYANQH
jgi:hypothetical protein